MLGEAGCWVVAGKASIGEKGRKVDGGVDSAQEIGRVVGQLSHGVVTGSGRFDGSDWDSERSARAEWEVDGEGWRGSSLTARAGKGRHNGGKMKSVRSVDTKDVVVISAKRSPYCGQTGVVEGWTGSGLSVYVRLRDGRRVTVREGSVLMVVARGEKESGGEQRGAGNRAEKGGADAETCLAAEVKSLRKEVVMLREVVEGIGKLLVTGEEA